MLRAGCKVFERPVLAMVISNIRSFSSTAPARRTEYKVESFIADQKILGVPTDTLSSDVANDIKYTMGELGQQAVQGPSARTKGITSSIFSTILGSSIFSNCSMLIDANRDEHLITGRKAEDAIRIYNGRLQTALHQLPSLVASSKNTVVVSTILGSLNTFEKAHGVNDDLISGLASMGVEGSKVLFGGGVSAETGVGQYVSSLMSRRINQSRNGYDLANSIAILSNYMAKQKCPLLKTINVSHSWGGPSIVQAYAYALAVRDLTEGHGIDKSILPIDGIVLVDPRFIADEVQKKIFAQQIQLLRSRGVIVSVVKDTGLKGFGLINSISGADFVEDTGQLTTNSINIPVDMLARTTEGHALAALKGETINLVAEMVKKMATNT